MAKQLSKKFIGNNEVDGSKILLENGQSIKIKDSVGTEVELVKLGVSDEVLVKGQEVALKSVTDAIQSDLDIAEGEINTLQSDVVALDGRLDSAEFTISTHTSQISSIQSDLSAETSARISADDALDSRLDSAEFTISTHTSQISSIQSDLSAETSARISADDALDSRLDSAEFTISTHTSQISSIQSDLSAETSARISADDALDGRLDSAEFTISTHTSQISTLQSDLSAETSARIAGDASLQSQIDAISGGGSGSLSALQTELDNTQSGAGLNSDGGYTAFTGSNYLSMASNLKHADFILDGQIKIVADSVAQEVSDRIADVADLQGQINNVLSNMDGAALDSLTEIVTAFQAADSSLNGAITSLSTGLSADIDAEEAARIAADTALQGEIDAEEIARAAADTTLQNNINSEAATRLAADNALDARVDVLESVVWFKEKFAISNGQTSVTLSHAPEVKSMSAWVDRLAIHEGAAEDFTISGTSMTFLNDLVSPGQSQIGNGDTVYVKYQYKV